MWRDLSLFYGTVGDVEVVSCSAARAQQVGGGRSDGGSHVSLVGVEE